MSQCVPSWDLDDTPSSARLNLHPVSNADSLATDVPLLDYEVAELTWENGQLAMHGLGPPRILTKPIPLISSKYTWEKPRAGGTLESIVNQATRFPPPPPQPQPLKVPLTADDELVPRLDSHCTATAPPITMDALVPCSNRPTTSAEEQSTHVPDPNPGTSTYVGGYSARVGSCSGAATLEHRRNQRTIAEKRARVARIPVAHEGSSKNHSESASATFGRDVTLDTLDMELDATSLGSPENTSSGMPPVSYSKPTTADDHDSVCHGSPQRGSGVEEVKKKGQKQKSSISTKRSRAAANHNLSERKRRDKINQRLKTLQKLVPNSSKTDKASMLDEVIEYLKQLQAQVQMMGTMMIPHMMLPMTMQQQLQMSMMVQMGMSMGMGMGMGVMDMNSIGRPNMAGIPPVLHPSAFMPLTSWDGSGDRFPASSTLMPDLLSTFLSSQSQPMTMDTCSRMAALYQQLHQTQASNSKN